MEPISYKDFRTDLTFYDVRQILWSWSDNPKDWKHVSRSTVLGKWHEIKRKMYACYLMELEECENQNQHIAQVS